MAHTSHISLIPDEDEEGGDTIQEPAKMSSFKTSPMLSANRILPSQQEMINTAHGHRGKSMQIRKGELGKSKEMLLLKILKHCEEFSERATNEVSSNNIGCCRFIR